MSTQKTSLAAAGVCNITLGAAGGNPENQGYIEISGTFTTLVGSIQGSIDGKNYANIPAIRLDTLALETTPTLTNSTTRQWRFDATGFRNVQFNLTSIATGTVVVSMTTLYVPVNPLAGALVAQSSNANVLPIAANTITSAGAGTVAAGALTGAQTVAAAFTNATPGAQTTRTGTQMFTDTPGAFAGMTYTLVMSNFGGSTVTLTAGVGVTIVGTATALTLTSREFQVLFTSTTTCTITNLGP
jgi:hypothetical protein